MVISMNMNAYRAEENTFFFHSGKDNAERDDLVLHNAVAHCILGIAYEM